MDQQENPVVVTDGQAKYLEMCRNLAKVYAFVDEGWRQLNQEERFGLLFPWDVLDKIKNDPFVWSQVNTK